MLKLTQPFDAVNAQATAHGKKRLVKNIASLGVVQIANYVLPLLSIPIISRIIGPEKFGVINFAVSFMAYFTLLIGYGFDLSATRKIAADPFNEANRNKVFSETFLCQLLLLGVSIVAFVVCLAEIPQLRTEWKVAVFSFLLCFSTLFTQNWLFQAMQELSLVALLNFSSKLLFTVAILLVVTHKQDYIWYPLVLNAINILISIVSFAWGYKRYKIRLIKVSFKRFPELLWKEKMIFLSLVVINLYSTTNIVILGLYSNPTQVGYYTSAQKLIFIALSILTLPLYQALYPFVGKAFGESREKGMAIVQKAVPLILGFTMISCAGIFILGPWALTLLYGKAFSPAIPVIRILAFVPMIVSLNNLFGIQVMLNMKMDKSYFYIILGGAVFSVTFNLLTLQRWGYIGTAINWLITEIIINISCFVVLRSKGLNPWNLSNFSRSAALEMIRPFRNKFTNR